MKHYFQKFITFLFILILNTMPAFSIEPVKINKMLFDSSDSLIYIQTKGEITDEVTVKKGFTNNPDKIYIDINNSILTTPKKSYTAKNSVFNNVKISQFTLEPNVVRIVFEYNKNFNPKDFQVFKTKNSIFIKTKNEMVSSPKFKIIYSNTDPKERTVFYKGTKFEEETDSLSPKTDEGFVNAQKTVENKQEELKVSSKYYINSISKAKNGVMINGIGKLSLMPVFSLTNPDRLIIDLDDTVVAQELRNKVFPIGEIQTVIDKNGQTTIDKRETVKIGQNSQNVARLVIQGENSKNYRGIISPDSKNLYLTNKANIISAKVSDNMANLTKTAYSSLKGLETAVFVFDDSAALSVFEENSNLYIDVNNLNTFDDGVLDPVKRAVPNFQTTRIALDKLRIVFLNMQNNKINVKTNPDNTELRVCFKPKTPKKSPVISAFKKKQPVISNLFKVVIDAGHGGSDVGATRNYIYEKDITLKIAKLVEKKLNDKKVKTYMTRDKDKTVSLQERSDYSNSIKPDVFVSIHVNSSTNDSGYGIETHWYKQDSKKYAEYVHKEMSKRVKGWKTVDRGLFNSKFYVINHTDAPAILCEIGFISNKNEREAITSSKRQDEIAQAIADGIYNYLRAKK